ncbi:hypothetical protein D3C77_687400 [compost metagenome]
MMNREVLSGLFRISLYKAVFNDSLGLFVNKELNADLTVQIRVASTSSHRIASACGGIGHGFSRPAKLISS